MDATIKGSDYMTGHIFGDRVTRRKQRMKKGARRAKRQTNHAENRLIDRIEPDLMHNSLLGAKVSYETMQRLLDLKQELEA